MKYRGVIYYPEAWPRERWPQDIAMMRDAGFNLVRLGEFAWSRIEPLEGKFDLEWLESVVDLFHAASIKVMLSVPSAGPPPWLSTNYPETLLHDENGHPHPLGIRRHYCPTSPRFREAVVAVTRALGKAFAEHPAVVTWQIDNEIAIGETSTCNCEHCIATFHEWLKQKHKTIANLNTAWNNVFWSSEFDSWEQIKPPFHRNSARLDWHLFQSAVFSDFIKQQSEILRSINHDWTLTTNSWIAINPSLDLVEIFRDLDVASYDCYVNYHGTLQAYRATWDLYRNIKQTPAPFWIAETGAWNCLTTLDNSLDALRAWFYEFFARGVDAVIYFRWRQSVMGEEHHPAVLTWSGVETDQYRKLQSIFKEFCKFEDEFTGLPLPDAAAAVVFDQKTALLAYCEKNSDYTNAVVIADELLNKMLLTPDVVPMEFCRDLSKYKLIVLPQLARVDKAFAEVLRKYVADGGVVLAQVRLGQIDNEGKRLLTTAPALLQDVFGIRIDERWDIKCTPRYGPAQYEPPAEGKTASHVRLEFEGIKGKGYRHMEKICPNGCEVLGEYVSGILAGHPFLSVNKYGSGLAFYQAVPADSATEERIVAMAARRAGLVPVHDIPGEVSVIKRGDILFHINNSSVSQAIPRPLNSEVLFGTVNATSITLKPFDVCVVKMKIKA